MNADRSRRRGRRRRGATFATLAALALAAAAVARAAAPTPATLAPEADGLATAVATAARLTRTQLAPEARVLAKGLPRITNRIGSLRQPAATTEEQLQIALGQLQQMSPPSYDSHYLAALLAVGRAYAAASGVDPLTGTALGPEYAGLGRELARGEATARRAGERAARLSRQARTLTASLSRERRRAAQLASALTRFRDASSRR